MKRNFKQIFVSFHIITTYGSEFAEKLMEYLPPNTQIMRSKENLAVASTQFLLYNPQFEELANNETVPSLPRFDMPPKPAVASSESGIIMPGDIQ
jgi:hypothetical protein